MSSLEKVARPAALAQRAGRKLRREGRLFLGAKLFDGRARLRRVLGVGREPQVGLQLVGGLLVLVPAPVDAAEVVVGEGHLAAAERDGALQLLLAAVEVVPLEADEADVVVRGGRGVILLERLAELLLGLGETLAVEERDAVGRERDVVVGRELQRGAQRLERLVGLAQVHVGDPQVVEREREVVVNLDGGPELLDGAVVVAVAHRVERLVEQLDGGLRHARERRVEDAGPGRGGGGPLRLEVYLHGVGSRHRGDAAAAAHHRAVGVNRHLLPHRLEIVALDDDGVSARPQRVEVERAVGVRDDGDVAEARALQPDLQPRVHAAARREEDATAYGVLAAVAHRVNAAALRARRRRAGERDERCGEGAAREETKAERECATARRTRHVRSAPYFKMGWTKTGSNASAALCREAYHKKRSGEDVRFTLPPKTSRAGAGRAPARESSGRLERELRAQSHRGRELEDQPRPVERVEELDAGGTGDAAVDANGLVVAQRALGVGDVVPVELEAQLTLLAERYRVVRAQVELEGRGRAALARGGLDRRAGRQGEALVVAVDRVRYQRVEGLARLRVEVAREHQLDRRAVAAVELELMRAVVRQTPVGVRQQARQVEQAGDGRGRPGRVVWG